MNRPSSPSDRSRRCPGRLTLATRGHDLARGARNRRHPETLLVLAAAYIGMELGTVYAALGSKCSSSKQWTPFARRGRRPGASGDGLREEGLQGSALEDRVAKMETKGKQIKVTFDADGQQNEELFDWVLGVSRPRSEL